MYYIARTLTSNQIPEKEIFMIRTRFAPSPTGLPHVGNIRTAIFNWLLAKSLGGKFILRIEDTDRTRFDPNALKAIMSALRWLKIDCDEGPQNGGDYGPYIQSERLEIYHHYARILVESGNAYYCDCSINRTQEAKKSGTAMMYNRRCRQRNLKGDPTDSNTVIRFKMPLERDTCFEDGLHGKLSFSNATQDDMVLVKSDGFPTYNYAVVIDDHLMKISHVLRGDEFLSSTSKHMQLYSAFGWQPPAMTHLPVILGPDRSKLSKRHGATAIGAFEEMGIVSETMFNFLSLVGWSPKDNLEILSREEIIGRFDAKGLTISPAIFDLQKLLWMNGEYIRNMTPGQLTEALLPLYAEWNWQQKDNQYLDRVSQSMQKRLKTLNDMQQSASFFFKDPESYEDKGAKKYFNLATAYHLSKFSLRISSTSDWREPIIEDAVRGYASENGITVAEIIHPLRLAVSGLCDGPSLFEIIEILGKDATVRRLANALRFIER